MTKILLVEDDKSLREIYGVRLLAEGYDIISAGDGEEALALAIKDRPDLILSDVMMPKISGFDMLDILRSTTETKGIRVIMMTALSSEEQRQRGVSLGADRYLVKSQVGIEDVVRSVHEVLSDAPVAGQAPLMAPSAPPATAPAVAPSVAPATPVPTPTPTVPARPVAPVPAPSMPTAAPVSTPATTTPPAAAATPVVPPQAPAAPAQPEPTAVEPPAPEATAQELPSHLPESVLPEPSAPFSTPRPVAGSLSERVIQPLASASNPGPDYSNLINKELSTPTAPTVKESSGIEFEETPRPTPPTPPSAAPVAAAAPAPAPSSAPAPHPTAGPGGVSLPPAPPAPNPGV